MLPHGARGQGQQVPYTTCQLVRKEHCAAQTYRRCHLVPEQKVVQMPYTTCRLVAEERSEVIPQRRCHWVTEQQVRKVPYVTCKYVAKECVQQVPETHCSFEPYKVTVKVCRQVPVCVPEVEPGAHQPARR